MPTERLVRALPTSTFTALPSLFVAIKYSDWVCDSDWEADDLADPRTSTIPVTLDSATPLTVLEILAAKVV